MATPILIAIVAAGAVLLVVLVLLLSRRGSGEDHKLRCGRCRRVMMPDWTRCMFCGWEKPEAVARLEFVSGPLAGQVVPMDGEITSLGSVAGNSIVLADPAVSRKHLAIRRVENRFELADLGSTNGVYVNGHRTAKKALAPGDVLRVGNTEMVFRNS